MQMKQQDSSELRGHIRVVIHQLRLQADVIELKEKKTEEELSLVKTLQEDYYYQKLLPLVICDSTREVYLYQGKKVLQNGVTTDVLEVKKGIGFCVVQYGDLAP